MLCIDLKGKWKLCLDEYKKYKKPPKGEEDIELPDSTAHAKKGREKTEPSIACMTDRYYFEGYAWYSREIRIDKSWTDKKITLFLERTRISTVYIDGQEIGTEKSLCGFHEHELTGKLKEGVHTLTVRVDNTNYPTRGGHMTSPDTQTNWNGILGRIELQIREQVYPYNLQVYANEPQKVVLTADICGHAEGVSQVLITGNDGKILYQREHTYEKGRLQAAVKLSGENLLWDEYSRNLFKAEVRVEAEAVSAYFGIRKLSHEGRRLLVNDKEVFWRGKHDGLVFPCTGYAPMSVKEWRKIFSIAKEYGINHYRFHTCCPPDAAFTAADEMGIYMEPELPFWGTIAAPGEDYYNEEEQAYLPEEGYRILRNYGNHPSFVMLSLGNELWGNRERINHFLHDYRQADNRHLYTQGSNNFQFCPAVLEEEDVFCGVRLSKTRLFRGSYAMCDAPQGHIQVKEPDSGYNYDEMIVPKRVEAHNEREEEIEVQYGTGIKKVKGLESEAAFIPEIPIISHEIGQYDFFPDFTELGRYEGSQQPLYLEVYRERMKKSGIFEQWEEFFKATGAFAIDCYRREIETALRTKELSGFQLLDLQDFPGQNVALVGVLNAWMDSKNLITPERWRSFCNDTVILGELNSFVVKEKEQIRMPVKLSVCHWSLPEGRQLCYKVVMEDKLLKEGCFQIIKGRKRIQDIGVVEFTVPTLKEPERVQIELWIPDTEYTNEYTLWAYPRIEIEITKDRLLYDGRSVAVAKTLEEAVKYKEKKQPFLFVPQKEEGDIEGTYCTDFWNYPMFRSISENMNRKVPVGTLGLYIQNKNKLFEHFQSEIYSTPQWFHMVMHSHCVILDGQDNVEILVQPIDNVERAHKLGMVYLREDMLVCTSRLWEISDCPEVRAFARALILFLYEYSKSQENDMPVCYSILNQ